MPHQGNEHLFLYTQYISLKKENTPNISFCSDFCFLVSGPYLQKN